ncbi:hypothetical protein HYU22_04720 [Candidatus Woesearchaeota archaeon]|nr:hypothetical protein [Candidatus Woesearchaeota archaeon]
MANYFSNTLKGMALAGIVTALSACDTDGKLELAIRQSDGPVTIRLTQEVKFLLKEVYILEVFNTKGKRLVYMRTYGEPQAAEIKVSPDKTYNLNEGGVRVRPNRF